TGAFVHIGPKCARDAAEDGVAERDGGCRIAGDANHVERKAFAVLVDDAPAHFLGGGGVGFQIEEHALSDDELTLLCDNARGGATIAPGGDEDFSEPG